MIDVTADMTAINAYMRSRWPLYPFREDRRGIAQTENGKITVAYVFDDANAHNANIHIEAEPNTTISRKLLREVARYCFIQLFLSRVTAEIDESNTDALRLAQRVGFEIEAKKYKAADDGGNVVVLVLWREKALQMIKKLFRGYAK